MPKLFDATHDREIGDIDADDLALLQRALPETASGRCAVDNDSFLALVDAGASARLLDAVKSVLDTEQQAEIRWQ